MFHALLLCYAIFAFESMSPAKSCRTDASVELSLW